MEDAPVIFEYLPRESRSPDEAKYLEFLWDSFHTNYLNDKYQFAFLAFHMLYMCYVYEVVWKIQTNLREEFNKSLAIYDNQEITKKLLKVTAPIGFGEQKEKFMFRFLKLLGATNDDIGRWSKTVDSRNTAAHPNGVISFSDNVSLDKQISMTIDYVNDIHKTTYPILDRLLHSFLKGSWNIENNSYSSLEEEISQNFIAKHHLSAADVMHLHYFDLTQLSDHEHYTEITVLFQLFKSETEDWGK